MTPPADASPPGPLAAHLGEAHGIEVAGLEPLDLGVFRVRRADGPDWVARIFPTTRPPDGAAGDAAILRALERFGFPAERCATSEPVSSVDGQQVLVTDFLEAGPPLRPGRSAAILGALLGRLHSHPATDLRPGGAWHHLAFVGGPREELAAALELLEQARARLEPGEEALYQRLREEIEAIDDCHDLPHAFVHPDFVPANAIPTADERLAIVDWTGAGRGPRLWSLGFLLWASGARSLRLVDAAVSRYRRQVALEHEELTRLAAAIEARPLTLACWSYCTGRMGLAEVLERAAPRRALAEAIADRARLAFAGEA
jgi:aminoglycoside phosphotransferase (APT) family kinase protein